MNKESTVAITGFEASIDDNGGEALKPGTRSLLEPIERTLQTRNHARRSRQQSTLDTASCRPPHILLLKTTSNKPTFVALKGAVRASIDPVNPNCM